MYRDRIHARSLDSNDHPSRHWVKGLWGGIRHEIPEGWRICGENVYAKHSIPYENLPTYFFVFSIWNEANECLSWKETLEVCGMLGLTAVPLIAEMEFDEKWLKDYYENMDVSVMEGYVVRNIEAFAFDDFQDNVAKVVRAKHVTSGSHWMFEQVVPNKLREQGTL
jgi:ATP-dependent RNA circularization protein (DNA/RNA ligase family)